MNESICKNIQYFKKNLVIKIRGNRLIRMCIYPFYIIQEKYLMKRYQNSNDAAYIKELNNKFSGKRCFVIGNGPSLVTEDLEQLKSEITFAANRIFNIFEYTDWRPTFYVSMDINSLPYMIKTIKKCGTFPKFINYRAKRFKRSKDDNIHYLFPVGRFNIEPRKSYVKSLNDDISKCIAKVDTVTVNAIEIAIYMGFSEIYLLGVDNDYAVKVDEHGKKIYDPKIKTSYFKGMKDEFGNLGDGQSFQIVDGMNYSYKLAKEFAEKKGIKIYNATRGGKLEIFDRINFDNIFNI